MTSCPQKPIAALSEVEQRNRFAGNPYRGKDRESADRENPVVRHNLGEIEHERKDHARRSRSPELHDLRDVAAGIPWHGRRERVAGIIGNRPCAEEFDDDGTRLVDATVSDEPAR